MKNLKKHITILAILITNSLNLFSQNKLEIHAPSYVELGDVFRVNYIYKDTKEQGKPSFTINSNDNFDVKNIGQSVSSFNNITFINGKLSAKQETDYTWTVYMSAKKEGALKLPPANVKLPDGTVVYASEYTINVGNTNNQLPQPKNNPNLSQTPSTTNIGKLSLILSLSRKNVYIGEPIVATLMLYSIYSIQFTDFKPGTYNGFWTQDLVNLNNISLTPKIINGQRYFTALLDKKIIFPQKTGELKITSYYAQAQIYDGWGFPAGIKEIYSNSPTVIVNPLPETGKPADFSGAVGNFSIKIETSADTTSVDRPYSIKLTISGTGNFGLFDDPKINLPPSFEKLEPNITENLSPTLDGITGSKTYEFIYVPRATGKYTIQPISFSFFNPQEKKYITLQTQSIPIIVVGTKDSTNLYTNTNDKKAMEQIAKDIHYIYTKPFKLHKKGIYCYKRDVFILSYLILFLATLIFIYWKREQIKLASDIRKQKFQQADKITRKYLKLAHKYLKINDLNNFYQAIDKALSDYITNKLGLSKSDLSLENIKQKLIENHINPDIAQLYVNIIKDCQTARFAPEIANVNPQKTINSAKKVITEIEKNFKTIKQ